MKRHISIFTLLLSAFSAFAAGSASDVMRLSPIGYRLGEAGVVTAYDPSVVTVTPGDTSIVYSNKSATLTAALNRDYKVVRWQKFAVDPTVRTSADPIEEFGEKSETVSVAFNGNVAWMYVTVVVEYDPVRTVKTSLSSFANGTVTVSPEKTSYLKGDVLTLTAEPAEGYAFVRWSDGNVDHARTVTVDGDIDLKAYIEPISSRVSFSAGAGAVLDVTSKRVSYDNAYGELPVPVRTGAKFSEWVDADGRTVTAKTAVNRVADHTLFASWGDLLYEIAWNFTGRGNGKVEGTGTYAYGSQPTLKAVPYEGSAFIGWADGETRNPRRIVVLSNALYVAAFDVATYDVTFTYRNASGNLVTAGPTTVEHGGKVDPPSQDVVDSWPEHTFKNWSTEEYKKVTRDLAVEAIYDVQTYEVMFAYHDWQGHSVTTMPQHVVSGGKANPPDRSVVDNWSGHSFKGWEPDYNVIRQDTLCRAIYETNTYTVTFSYRGPDGEPREQVETVRHGGMMQSVPETAVVDSWPGHRFLGWSNEDYLRPITGRLEVFARYEGYCTIIYGDSLGTNYWDDVKDPKDWTNLRPVAELNEVEGYIFEKMGHEFGGWKTNEAGNIVYGDGARVRVQNGDVLALISKWDPIQYKIGFDLNGGTGDPVKDMDMTYGEGKPLPKVPSPAPDGTSLAKAFWTAERNNTNSACYKYGDTVSNLTTKAGERVILYAYWPKNTYDVKIDDGHGGTKTVPMEYGSEIDDPGVPAARAGYQFTGWLTNNVAVEKFPITVPVNGITLKADWTTNAYTVVFNGTDADGGTMEPQEFTYGVAQALALNGFTRTGYTFANWTNEVGKAFADGAQVKNLATNDGAVVDLYATWMMNPRYYAVRFNPNGGAGAPYVQDIECGVETALTPNRFARTGYGFANWTNATGTVYANGQKVTNLAPEDETNDFYAVWTANRYWVAFEGNGADGGEAMENQAFTYDVAQALTSNAFTRTGYSFAGWVVSAPRSEDAPRLAAPSGGFAGGYAGTVDYTDGAIVSNLTATADATNALWATWAVKSYEISFDPAGGSAVAPVTNEYGKAVSAPTPAKKGHQFDGWYEGEVEFDFSSMPARNVRLTARWTANAYTVEFRGTGEAYTQGFTYDEPQALEANRFAAPEMRVFDRWTNAVDSTTYTNCETVCNLTTGGVFVLYATWKDAPSYAVAYDGNGADGGSMATNRFECGKGGTLALNKFVRTGYAFGQWTNKVNGATYGNGATFMEDLASTNGTATLSALWTANRYWVKFEGNGADGGEKMENQAFTYDVAQALTSNAFTRTGYSFAGWVVSAPRSEDAPRLAAPSGGFAGGCAGTVDYTDGAVVSNLTAMADATNTLWATWAANHYTVGFNPGEGTGEAYTQGFTYDQAQKLMDNTFEPPELKSFAGWATNETGKAVYANGAEVRNLTAEADATVNLYAVWGDDSYAVDFDGNGATGGTMVPQVFKHGETDTLTPNAYVRTGCGFANWTNASNDAYLDEASFTAPKTGIGETLYAVWTNKIYNCSFYESVTGDQMLKYGEKIVPSPQDPPGKVGYTFEGWTTNGSDRVDLETFTMPDHDVLFTPLRTPITYTIAFDGNEATSGSMAPTNVKYGVEIALPSNAFERTGYGFAGWDVSAPRGEDAAGTVVYTDGEVVSNLTAEAGRTVTLYAVWNQIADPLKTALGFDPNDLITVTADPTDCWESAGDNTINLTKDCTITFRASETISVEVQAKGARRASLAYRIGGVDAVPHKYGSDDFENIVNEIKNGYPLTILKISKEDEKSVINSLKCIKK